GWFSRNSSASRRDSSKAIRASFCFNSAVRFSSGQKRAFPIRFGEVGPILLFDEKTLLGQPPHDACDDLLQVRPGSSTVGPSTSMKIPMLLRPARAAQVLYRPRPADVRLPERRVMKRLLGTIPSL